jgi:hypothetical protein
MEAVGQYSNYLLLYTTIKSLLNKIYSAVKASAGNLFATQGIAVRYRFFLTMNYLTMVFYGTAAVGVAVCADELIETWIGTEYMIAKPAAILIGIEILFEGIRQNLGQMRTITGVFRQAWTRPLMSILINIIASIALVGPLGIHGVLLGTIIANILTNFLVDPSIIHKYSFDNYRPVSEYYVRNMAYILELFAVGAVDMWLCGKVFVGHEWFSVFIHIIIVGISVPAVLIALYWRSDECEYLWSIAKRILRKVKRT